MSWKKHTHLRAGLLLTDRGALLLPSSSPLSSRQGLLTGTLAWNAKAMRWMAAWQRPPERWCKGAVPRGPRSRIYKEPYTRDRPQLR